MRIDRLEQLVAVMEKVRDLALPLRMGTWMEETDEDRRPQTAEEAMRCGTAACALGWVALSPEVPEVWIVDGYPTTKDRFGRDQCGFSAARSWLECEDEEAWLLFDSASYEDHEDHTGRTDPDLVIEHARLLMKPNYERDPEYRRLCRLHEWLRDGASWRGDEEQE